MTCDPKTTTSPANITPDLPPAIEAIPQFFVGVEGGKIQINHRPQEIPLDDPRSTYTFFPESKPFVATAAVARAIPNSVVMVCLQQLILFAKKHNGLDYLQTFIVEGSSEPLWFIEDDAGGAITALFPSDY
jgi:hypothetical protein